MVRGLKWRVRGNSIIEVVVAILLISLSMALSGVLFASLFNSSERVLKQRAWYEVSQIAHHTRWTADMEAVVVEKQGVQIQKKTERLDEDKGIWLVIIQAMDTQQKHLAQRRFLMQIQEDKDE